MSKLNFFHKRYKKNTLDKEEIRKQEIEKQEIISGEIIGLEVEEQKIYPNKIEELRKNGIDIERGIKRFSGKRTLYLKYLKVFTKDESMQEIRSCMEAEDYQLAQKKVHAIKGIVGNLSIDVLYDSSCQLMDALREEKIEKAKKLFQQMDQVYIQVCDLISEIEEE